MDTIEYATFRYDTVEVENKLYGLKSITESSSGSFILFAKDQYSEKYLRDILRKQRKVTQDSVVS